MDELEARHRREVKEMRAQVQSIKKLIPKGDKKRKKEAAEEIARLEHDLEQRHARELADAVPVADAAPVADMVPVDDATVDNTVDSTDSTDQDVGSTGRKPNRQQMRKMKKAAAMEQMRKEAELEALNAPRPKEVEDAKLASLLLEHKRRIHEIVADGHCMYSAIAHQLSLRPPLTQLQLKQCNYSDLRRLAGDFMLANPDAFQPFLADTEAGSSDSAYRTYCERVQSSAEWGGQLELQAVSQALRVPLRIVQADGPVVDVGAEFAGSEVEPLWLSYHRHAYGLGEHYNSLPAAE